MIIYIMTNETKNFKHKIDQIETFYKNINNSYKYLNTNMYYELYVIMTIIYKYYDDDFICDKITQLKKHTDEIIKYNYYYNGDYSQEIIINDIYNYEDENVHHPIIEQPIKNGILNISNISAIFMKYYAKKIKFI